MSRVTPLARTARRDLAPELGAARHAREEGARRAEPSKRLRHGAAASCSHSPAHDAERAQEAWPRRRPGSRRRGAAEFASRRSHRQVVVTLKGREGDTFEVPLAFDAPCRCTYSLTILPGSTGPIALKVRVPPPGLTAWPP